MTRKFGVSMDEYLAERVEDGLEYGSSRSDRICELLELGLAVEAVADERGLEIPENRRSKQALIRQAFIDADL